MRALTHRSFTAKLVYVFESLMPDPFVLAIALTAIVGLAAGIFSPHRDLPTILTSWYSGLFNIFGFAFQMIMILVSGHALAHAPWIRRALEKIVSIAKSPQQAVVLIFLLSAAASWLNWGFGLVIGAMLATEVARRIPADFGWLVAAGYSGWMFWASGPSGSIPLAQASHGNTLNIVEKVTGKILPFSDSIFTTFTIVPTLVALVLVPLVFLWARPQAAEAVIFTPLPEVLPAPRPPHSSFARRAENSPIGSLFLAGSGVAYLLLLTRDGTLRLDANLVIFVFIMLGLFLHVTPINYIGAVRNAARQTGSMMLQYPIYGGIMGIMTGTGLAQTISEGMASASTAHTLPFYSFLSSLLITFIVPSGGGHWAVQGPFTVPAAVHIHASVAGTTMAVAFGEQVANMIQPFWVLPVVAIAGIGVQRVLAFTTLSFLVGAVVYGSALLISF